MEDSQFESRKRDHIRWSLDPQTQTRSLSSLEQIELLHEALPEIDLEDVTTDVSVLGLELRVPFFVSSMTAGHRDSYFINECLAELSSEKKMLVGVGSQRRELFDDKASLEWKQLRKKFPRAILGGNLGLSQLILAGPNQILKLLQDLEPQIFFIHTNPLQEALQREGTPQFREGSKTLEQFCRLSPVPVVLKEVGCGINSSTLQRLRGIGLGAVDVSGRGGTHWGRLEGLRFDKSERGYELAQTFKDWGQNTVDCLIESRDFEKDYELWASGGLRSGLDVAKVLALGAKLAGIAQPWMKCFYNFAQGTDFSGNLKTLEPDQARQNLRTLFENLKQELRVAMFCMGVKTPLEFYTKKVWKWRSRN